VSLLIKRSLLKNCYSLNSMNLLTASPLLAGHIELIIGPMFAGKSTELMRRVKRHEISGKKCLTIKYSGDNRYSEECIASHDK